MGQQQVEFFERQWPQTAEVLKQHFFETLGYSQGNNPARYFERVLIDFEVAARKHFADLHLTPEEIDNLAATEILFQHYNRNRFNGARRNWVTTLGHCLRNHINDSSRRDLIKRQVRHQRDFILASKRI